MNDKTMFIGHRCGPSKPTAGTIFSEGLTVDVEVDKYGCQQVRKVVDNATGQEVANVLDATYAGNEENDAVIRIVFALDGGSEYRWDMSSLASEGEQGNVKH